MHYKEVEARHEVVFVTPTMANNWLVHNTKNRRMNEVRVRTYAHDMAGGKWRFSGDPIKFGRSGRLLDGQKRLRAVVVAGCGQFFSVWYELPDNVFEACDIGEVRSCADTLFIHGAKNNTTLAAAARQYWNITSGALTNAAIRAECTRAELLSLIEAEPGLQQSASFAKGLNQAQKFLAPSIMAATHFIFSKLDPPLADEFFAKLDAGDSIARNNPILVLRNLLSAAQVSRKRYHQTHLIALVIKAWNFARAGRTITFLRWTRSGDGKEEFPVAI